MAKLPKEPVDNWEIPAVEALRATPDIRVADIVTKGTPGFVGDKAVGERLLEERGARLSALQELLYANGRSGDTRSVLLVLQGMDTAGKGGMLRHVIGHVDPQGVDHASFGVPTAEEKRHDYLWRIRKALPRNGQLGVFDRSHYEDVLVVRVHNLVPPEVWEPRYEEINAFERELVESGTTIVKVAMFVSLDEQKARLAERLERPDKYWKFNPGDITERGFWPEYQKAYQAMLDRTSTEHAPWHVVPCDRKWYSRLAVTELLIDALENLDLDWPPADFDIDEQKARLAES
ncbi:PPK2 family polyphosphate:nucleotide phosphotransferase [Rhodococcus sp. OK611]|uniref:polyphosphate kinase 2 family protein n=1 Tax=unclassified Rhodococcus (in: high G+C Gram-positive bacteria) TaxID=192944 RepID=UPI000BCAA580|nr:MULTISPECIES: polyphosphate kinase 2 family protein [unclassified Rhodococcus (in: high G+C Gram-positive bacteria)]PTR45127.1 PPK2 family polyphosphate:nucleotide phosphotransferase [Rhodococcus sp. OK611]SNX89462.1 polyphosphate:nucleotide phosphotransferase, PPK2 family [Rhodococcus sp. OK270]